MKKRLVVEFVFEEEIDEDDPEWVYLVLTKIGVVKSDLTAGQRSALGEEVAQTDRWQVNRWNDIQAVLGGKDKVKIK